jgi:four helix bundle protein
VDCRLPWEVAESSLFNKLERKVAILANLAVAAHGIAASLPLEHRFELASQIRRASVSVPSNIAEGHAQKNDKIFLRHISIALGSLAELESQIEIAARLKLLDVARRTDMSTHTARSGQLLQGMRRSLVARIAAQRCQSEHS